MPQITQWYFIVMWCNIQFESPNAKSKSSAVGESDKLGLWRNHLSLCYETHNLILSSVLIIQIKAICSAVSILYVSKCNWTHVCNDEIKILSKNVLTDAQNEETVKESAGFEIWSSHKSCMIKIFCKRARSSHKFIKYDASNVFL